MNAGLSIARSMSAVLIVAGTFPLSGCQQENGQEPVQTAQKANIESGAPVTGSDTPAFVGRYVQLRDQAGERLSRDTRALCASIEHLLGAPDASALQQARSSWNYAHDAFLGWQTLDFGQRDREQALRQARHLDAWPIMAGYIDYTADHPASGIVYDTTVELDLETLLEQHQLTDPSEVSIGFHALEFLLWGEAEGSRRSAADFSLAGAKDADAKVIRRRHTYLGTLCGALENATRQVSAGDQRTGLAPAEIVRGLADVLEELVLEQRIVASLESRLPDPECGFSETPMCGIQSITKALRTVFVESDEPEKPDAIVDYALQHAEQFGVELEPATRSALGALESLADPTQPDDLFAAEALSRKWLAEIRTLQRSISRSGSPSHAKP